MNVLIIFLLLNFYIFSCEFKKYSSAFSIIENSEEISNINISNSILVTDKNEHSIISLALVKPIYYITDAWNPDFTKINFDENLIKFYKVKLIGNHANFEYMGKVKTKQKLQAPMTAKEVEKMIFEDNQWFIFTLWQ